jgi:DNA-binding winged helix-turn-helix (wHTH) protein
LKRHQIFLNVFIKGFNNFAAGWWGVRGHPVNNESKVCYFKFRNFTLDLERRVLLRDGEPVPLTPKAFDTLALLVRRSGHVVGKAELLEAIWADSFVEESTIAQNVFTLRKALGQNRAGNQFIETVPKHGYRFIADVETVGGGTDAVGDKIGEAEIGAAETGKAEIGAAETGKAEIGGA